MTFLETTEEIQSALGQSPFQVFLGLLAVYVEPASGMVELSLPFKPAFSREDGGSQVHGGVIASIIDIAGDYALSLGLGHFVPTINMRTDYLRPAHGDLRIVARAVRKGRTIGHAGIEVFDGEKRLVATGQCIYAMGVG